MFDDVLRYTATMPVVQTLALSLCLCVKALYGCSLMISMYTAGSVLIADIPLVGN